MALPAPPTPSMVIAGANEVWLTNWNMAASPVGDRAVGMARSSACTSWMIVEDAWVEPVGEEKIPAKIGPPFLKMDNWHGSMW